MVARADVHVALAAAVGYGVDAEWCAERLDDAARLTVEVRSSRKRIAS